MIHLAVALLLCAAPDETGFTHESFDGLKIDAKLALPEGVKEADAARVVILVGGSGPYDMDLDLTLASKDKKTKILWLRDVSDALVAKGFAVIRYHKRPYQLGELIKKVKAEGRKPTEEEQALVRRFQENPLKHFVDDCKSFAEGARKRFPKAKVLLLGGSEGTHVALWAARELKGVAGVALVGFYSQSLDTTTYEQAVHRSESQFRKLDEDNDGYLSKAELKKGGGLITQLEACDFDRDGRMSLTEFRSLCLVGHSQAADVGAAYREQEAKYPTMWEVLKASEIPVAFFQGMWDNQTPAFNAMAAEVLAKYVWKKSNLSFVFFPKLGHCLDPRESSEDLFYAPPDPDALKKLASDLDALVK